MSNKALKRIKNDIKIITSSSLHDEGIYVSFDDENLFHARALVIGPYIKDSPYQGGFYFFDINFPNNYPLNPPTVKFMTLNNFVRFNPNYPNNNRKNYSICIVKYQCIIGSLNRNS